MSFELAGKVIEKFEINQVTDSFKKREFVIEKTDNSSGMEFTDQIKFQLTQDRCNLIDNINPDDYIKVNFNIRGRKWEKEGRISYFTNLEAWKIEKITQNEKSPEPPPFTGDDIPPPEVEDDLPF